MSSSVKPGKCVVCGKETFLRCQPCAQNGIEWMCFCSTEHQRLIFAVHRRVCGIRSNPFYFPAFTEKELEPISEPLVGFRHAAQLVDSGKIASEVEIEGMRYLVVHFAREEQVTTTEDRIQLQTARAAYLEALLKNSAKPQRGARNSKNAQSVTKLLIAHPFDFLAYALELWVPGSKEANVHRTWPFWTTLLHKLVIAFALTEVDPEAYSDLAVEEVWALIRDVISSTHPEAVRGGIAKLVGYMFEGQESQVRSIETLLVME